MRPEDSNDYDDFFDDGDDGVYADAERLYQAAYEEVYPDEYDDLAASPRWPWWRTRQGQVALLVGGVIGVVILALLVRGVNLPGQAVVRITATPATLPAGGAAQPVNVPTAQPSPVVSVAWPADVEYVVNTIPAMIKNTIVAVGERQGYRFDGRAGEMWLIAVQTQDNFDPLVTLYAPSGDVLGTNDDRSASDLSSEIQVTLPETGTYRVLVESSAGGLTVGAYVLSLLGVG
ncbi:PPC domain-containing protein [Aggregatilinea lenta]|uniref:PPC domain-containing protein n=1 Tax=Aggregatilinea lenta TaxID=913108 RepID=UPI000E5A8DF2|nr:PPC domain-containing protein [Aggregatilinea lenta]